MDSSCSDIEEDGRQTHDFSERDVLYDHSRRITIIYSRVIEARVQNILGTSFLPQNLNLFSKDNVNAHEQTVILLHIK